MTTSTGRLAADIATRAAAQPDAAGVRQVLDEARRELGPRLYPTVVPEVVVALADIGAGR